MITMTDEDKYSPFHRAAAANAVDVGVLMLEQMPDLLFKPTTSQDSIQPVHIAAIHGAVEFEQMLIEKGASPNDLSGNHRTPLHFACLHGRYKTILFLLEKGADLTITDINNHDPLILAQNANQTKVCELLMNRGMKSSIHEAVREENVVKIREILKQSVKNLEAPDQTGRTPLHWASMKGFYHICEVLLEFGANTEARDKDNFTALLLSSRNGEEDIVKLLISKGADINARDSDGFSAFDYTVIYGHLSILECFLSRGTDPDTPTQNGQTALHLSAKSGNPLVLELLLKHHANVCVQDNDGNTPLHLVIEAKHNFLVNNLLSVKSNVLNVFNHEGNTPLMTAIQMQNPSAIEMLLKNKSNPDLQNTNGMSALFLAVQSDNEMIVQLLLRYKININIKDTQNRTPLFHAIEQKNEKIVALLLENKAKPNLSDKNKKTPLDCAIEARCGEIIGLLLRYKAKKRTIDEKTPLLHFCIKSDFQTPDCIASILRHFDKLNIRDENGNTALLVAAMENKVEIFKAILSKAPQFLKETNNDGDTVLHFVSSEIFRLVFQHKSTLELVNTKNKRGELPIHISCLKGNIECCKMLVEKNSELNTPNSAGYSPILIAEMNDHLDCVDFLLTRPGIVTPIEEAISKKDVELLKYYFANNLTRTMNYKNASNRTPIQLVAEWGNEDIADLFLRNGADLLSYPDLEKPHMLAKKHHPDSICTKILSSEFSRRFTISQLAETEANFIKSLNNMVLHLLSPLRAEKIFKEQEIISTFQNIEEILRDCNKYLQVPLQDRLAVFTSETCVGDILSAFTSKIDMYIPYNTSFETTMQNIKEWKKNSSFSNLLKAFEAKSRSMRQKADLESILIQPIQRMGHYLLLYGDIAKRTPRNHKDYPLVAKALELMNQKVKLVNEKKREKEIIENLEKIQKKLEGNSNFDLFSQLDRVFIKEGEILVHVTTTQDGKHLLFQKEDINNLPEKKKEDDPKQPIINHSELQKLGPKLHHSTHFESMREPFNPSHSKPRTQSFVAVRPFKIRSSSLNTKQDLPVQQKRERLSILESSKNAAKIQSTLHSAISHLQNFQHKKVNFMKVLLFLFNDYLILCTKRKGHSVRVKKIIPLIQTFIESNAKISGESDYRGFKLFTKFGILSCFLKDQQEIEDWQEKIQNSLETATQLYFKRKENTNKQAVKTTKNDKMQTKDKIKEFLNVSRKENSGSPKDSQSSPNSLTKMDDEPKSPISVESPRSFSTNYNKKFLMLFHVLCYFFDPELSRVEKCQQFAQDYSKETMELELKKQYEGLTHVRILTRIIPSSDKQFIFIL
eukprot:Anaeramoba_ignava/c21303_g1_i3.p1 GENE.c21303_g1_i3~~c21303_g1_i3.p1  ORF type:complete len:1308 (-),score=367.66 c21303_g1_i3:89-4012(-)